MSGEFRVRIVFQNVEIGSRRAYTFEIPLYHGITRANAIKAIHHACTLRCKQIEEEAQVEALGGINAEVCQTLFVETCMGIADPDLAPSGEADLGLDLPTVQKPLVSDSTLRKHIEALL